MSLWGGSGGGRGIRDDQASGACVSVEGEGLALFSRGRGRLMLGRCSLLGDDIVVRIEVVIDDGWFLHGLSCNDNCLLCGGVID